MLVGKVGYFKGTYGQAGYIWVTVMVWERAGTMLIILSVADNCTVPTNKIEPNVSGFLRWYFQPFPTWTLRSLSIFHCRLMPSVKVARAGQDINCDCPQEFPMFCGTPGQGASKITVPEGVLYYDPLCSSGVGRQPFVEPIQQTAWDNTLSSHQVNCWLTYFPAVKHSDGQFHIYRIL